MDEEATPQSADERWAVVVDEDVSECWCFRAQCEKGDDFEPGDERERLQPGPAVSGGGTWLEFVVDDRGKRPSGRFQGGSGLFGVEACHDVVVGVSPRVGRAAGERQAIHR